MFFKSVILVLLFAGSLFFLKYNEMFYKFCKKTMKFHLEEQSESNNAFMGFLNEPKFNQTQCKKIEKLKAICKEFHVDYSQHALMKSTLGKLNDLLFGKFDSADEKFISKYLDKIELHSIKYTFYIIQFIHSVIYISFLYLFVISIPNLIIKFVINIFNKLLFLIFIALLIEGVLKIYFKINTDITQILDKDNYSKYLDMLPVKFFMTIWDYFYELFKRFF
jgi:hypothetical protein